MSIHILFLSNVEINAMKLALSLFQSFWHHIIKECPKEKMLASENGIREPSFFFFFLILFVFSFKVISFCIYLIQLFNVKDSKSCVILYNIFSNDTYFFKIIYNVTSNVKDTIV